MPAFLAAAAVGVSHGCNHDDKPTTETNDTSSASATGPTSGGTTVVTTTASTSAGTDTGATTGAMFPDCKAIMDKTACEMTPSCVWPPELLSCIVDCPLIMDPITCAENSPCTWFEDKCQLLLI